MKDYRLESQSLPGVYERFIPYHLHQVFIERSCDSLPVTGPFIQIDSEDRWTIYSQHFYIESLSQRPGYHAVDTGISLRYLCTGRTKFRHREYISSMSFGSEKCRLMLVGETSAQTVPKRAVGLLFSRKCQLRREKRMKSGYEAHGIGVRSRTAHSSGWRISHMRLSPPKGTRTTGTPRARALRTFTSRQAKLHRM